MVTFDPDKNRTNRTNHKIALSAAEDFNWATAIVEEDRAENYGERRERAIGFIGEHIYVYVYTMRGDEDRAISLRRATRSEINYYAKNC